MSNNLEKLDRRAFLRGLTLTSAGLLVPKAVQVFMPSERIVYVDSDFSFGEHVNITRIHDSIIVEAPTFAEGTQALAAIVERNRKLFPNGIGPLIFDLDSISTTRTQIQWPNRSNTPKPA
jgi:hypothetical protein